MGAKKIPKLLVECANAFERETEKAQWAEFIYQN